MKYIVWSFGDGSTQYTPVVPRLIEYPGEDAGDIVRRLETEDEHIARLVATRAPRLSPVRLDGTVRTEAERLAYEASLGAGAKAKFAGIISGAEYEAKNRAREYREAWTWTTPEPVIDIDMVKARDICRHGLRRRRKPLLEALDVEVRRAARAGNVSRVAELNAQYQPLLDVTADPAIEVAQTVEDLKAVVERAKLR